MSALDEPRAADEAQVEENVEKERSGPDTLSASDAEDTKTREKAKQLLVDAVKSVSIDRVKAILDAHPNLLNHRYAISGPLWKHAGSLLHLAARYQGSGPLINELFRRGIRVDELDSERWTALHHAAYAGNLDNVRVLLQDLSFGSAVTALHIACKWGHNPQLVTYLIRRGLSVNSRSTHGWTPLHYAASGGDLLTVRVLLDQHGAKLSDRTNHEETALHLTFSAAVTRELIRRGLSWQSRDRLGNTALTNAVKFNNLGMARVLIDEAGASADSFITLGFCQTPGFEMFWFLLARGADPSCFGVDSGMSHRRHATKLRNWSKVASFLKSKHPVLFVSEPSGGPYPNIFEEMDSLNFDHLREVILVKCQLKALPPGWRLLPHLATIVVDDNELTELPSWLADMKSIVALRASNNRISSVLALPPNLTDLILSSNSLTEISAPILKCAQLIYVDLSNNKITNLGRGLAIADLSALQILLLRDNPLTGSDRTIAQSMYPTAVMDHFRELIHGSSPPLTVRLMLLGDTNAGKTTIRRTLTDGVNVIDRWFSRELDREKRKTLAPIHLLFPLPASAYPQDTKENAKRSPVQVLFTDPPGDSEVAAVVQRFVIAERVLLVLVVSATELTDAAVEKGHAEAGESSAAAVCRRWLSLANEMAAAATGIQSNIQLASAASTGVRTLFVLTHRDKVANLSSVQANAEKLLTALCRDYPLVGLQPQVVFINALLKYEIHEQLWPKIGSLACDLTLKSNQLVPPFYNTLPSILHSFCQAPPPSLSSRPLRCVSKPYFIRLLSTPALGGLNESQALLAINSMYNTGFILLVDCPSIIGTTTEDEAKEEPSRTWVIVDPEWFGMATCSVMSPLLIKMKCEYPDKATESKYSEHPNNACSSMIPLCECTKFDTGRISGAGLCQLLGGPALTTRLTNTEHGRGLDIADDEEAYQVIRLLQAMEVLVVAKPLAEEPLGEQELLIPSRLLPAPDKCLLRLAPDTVLRTFAVRLRRAASASKEPVSPSAPMSPGAPEAPNERSWSLRFPPGFASQLLSRLLPRLSTLDRSAELELHRDCVGIVRVCDDPSQRYHVRVDMDHFHSRLDCIAAYLAPSSINSSAAVGTLDMIARVCKEVESASLAVLSDQINGCYPITKSSSTTTSSTEDDDENSSERLSPESKSNPKPPPAASITPVLVVSKLCPLCLAKDPPRRHVLRESGGVDYLCQDGSSRDAVNKQRYFWSVFPSWEAAPQNSLPPYTEAESMSRRPIRLALNGLSSSKSSSVFLCHSGSNKSEVVRLYLCLHGAGVEAWMDRLDSSTHTFSEHISAAISSCSVFVAVIGFDFMEKEWCRHEVAAALERHGHERQALSASKSSPLVLLPVYLQAGCDSKANKVNPELSKQLNAFQAVINKSDLVTGSVFAQMVRSILGALNRPIPSPDGLRVLAAAANLVLAEMSSTVDSFDATHIKTLMDRFVDKQLKERSMTGLYVASPGDGFLLDDEEKLPHPSAALHGPCSADQLRVIEDRLIASFALSDCAPSTPAPALPTAPPS